MRCPLTSPSAACSAPGCVSGTPRAGGHSPGTLPSEPGGIAWAGGGGFGQVFLLEDLPAAKYSPLPTFFPSDVKSQLPSAQFLFQFPAWLWTGSALATLPWWHQEGSSATRKQVWCWGPFLTPPPAQICLSWVASYESPLPRGLRRGEACAVC